MTSLCLLSFLIGAGRAAGAGPDLRQLGPPELNRLNARFAPTELRVDLKALPEGEQKALGKLIEAARVMDGIFLRQQWSGNQTLLFSLARDLSPLGRARLHAFLINRGPWSQLEHHAPFLPDVPERPPGANFYPADTTREELERWMKLLPEPARQQAAGFFTVIRRGPDGKFLVVPYSVEYQGELLRAAGFLREAAALTRQSSLKAFLYKRANAFLNNDYYESDVAWMELDSSIEPTIGPYEVYADEWFNAKAAFEAFIAVRDDAETARLQRLGDKLQDIEDHLPVDDRLKNRRLGALSPIRIVNLVFGAGDGGVQTAAYNLPNDERTVKERGSKRVMLKNVQEAKFRTVLLPIAKKALAPADQKLVSFEPFFTHILMHELLHGLGPHNIQVGARSGTVRQALLDAYSAIEEAKADVAGLFAMQYLIDRGVLDKALEQSMYATYLASAFRSIRFGVGEAHGKGIALQLNYLLDVGALKVGRDGTFLVEKAKIREAVAGLTRELLMLEGRGDRARAQDLLGKLGVVRPEVQRVLDRLTQVPVDIEPRYVSAGQQLP